MLISDTAEVFDPPKTTVTGLWYLLTASRDQLRHSGSNRVPYHLLVVQERDVGARLVHALVLGSEEEKDPNDKRRNEGDGNQCREKGRRRRRRAVCTARAARHGDEG